eukprot:gene12275-23631_t
MLKRSLAILVAIFSVGLGLFLCEQATGRDVLAFFACILLVLIYDPYILDGTRPYYLATAPHNPSDSGSDAERQAKIAKVQGIANVTREVAVHELNFAYGNPNLAIENIFTSAADDMTATPSKFGEGFGGPGAPLRSPTLEVWDDVVDNLPPSLDLPAAQDKMGMSALRIFRRGANGDAAVAARRYIHYLEDLYTSMLELTPEQADKFYRLDDRFCRKGMQMKRNMYYDALVKANWSEKAAEEALLAQRKAGAGRSSKGKKKGGKSKSRLNAGGNHNAAGIDGAEAAGGAAAAAAALRQQQRASPPKRPRLSSTGGSGHKSLLRQFKVIGEPRNLAVDGEIPLWFRQALNCGSGQDSAVD